MSLPERPFNLPLLTQREVCQQLRICAKQLQILRRTRQIPFLRFGHRSIRFRQEAVEQYLRRRQS